jgi:biotin transport system substrate-specific component
MARLRDLPVFAAALVAAITGGIVVEYTCGVLGLMAVARMSLSQALIAIAVFVPGDLLKALATAFVAEASRRSYPTAIASRL